MGRKKFYWRFKRVISNISLAKTWTCLKKGNLKRETESLLIAAQNNAMRPNQIKARTDNTLQKSRSRPWGDRDETRRSVTECSNLAQKESKTRNNCVGKVIHWQFCKKFIFDHTNKWYMHKPASALKNEIHNLQFHFDMQTYHLISTRRPHLIITKKENLQNCALCYPGWPPNKIER